MCGDVVFLGGIVDTMPPVTTLTVVVLGVIFGVVVVVVVIIIGELWLQLLGDVGWWLGDAVSVSEFFELFEELLTALWNVSLILVIWVFALFTSSLRVSSSWIWPPFSKMGVRSSAAKMRACSLMRRALYRTLISVWLMFSGGKFR